MRPKTFVILTVLFCVVGLAAFLVFKQDRSRRQTQMGQRLFSELPVNDVARIRVEGPDDESELKKGPAVWVVENRFSYPADFDKIAELVKKIRDLKVGRDFQADQEVRRRLSLFPPQQGGSVPAEQQGTRIILSAKDGETLADLLVGSARQAGSGGRHLMKLEPPGDDSVYLVDANFRSLSASPDNWLFKDLMDVKAVNVEQVTCLDPKDGTLIYRLRRPGKGSAPVLENLAAKENADPARIDRVFGALTGMAIDGVAGPRGAVDLTGMDNHRRFEYRLYDGTQYTIETAKGSGGNENYLAVGVSYHPAAPTAEQGEEAAGSADTKAEANPAEKAARLDQKVRPWLYRIATWRNEGLVPDRTGLLASGS
jgi:hypothetical protein